MKIHTLPSGLLMVNTYLVIDEESNKAFIVDPGGYDKKLVETAEAAGAEIEYILITHSHGDHIGGVQKYKEVFPNIKIVSSKEDAHMLADAKKNMSVNLGMETEITPDITVSDNETMKIGNMDIKFLLTPGHTPGGVCILCGSNVLFSGDTLFRASIGRTDFPGCSFEELVKSIRTKLFVLPDETNVFPGHMEPTTIGYEKRNNPFV